MYILILMKKFSFSVIESQWDYSTLRQLFVKTSVFSLEEKILLKLKSYLYNQRRHIGDILAHVISLKRYI